MKGERASTLETKEMDVSLLYSFFFCVVCFVGWEVSSCAMESLYDVDLISEKIPVILDDSETWHIVLSTGMKLKERGIAHVNGATTTTSRRELNDSTSHYANLLLINRTASPLAW